MNFSRFTNPVNEPRDLDRELAIADERADAWHDQAVDREAEKLSASADIKPDGEAVFMKTGTLPLAAVRVCEQLPSRTKAGATITAEQHNAFPKGRW